LHSRRDDLTLANPLGPVRRGWAEVRRRSNRPRPTFTAVVAFATRGCRGTSLVRWPTSFGWSGLRPRWAGARSCVLCRYSRATVRSSRNPYRAGIAPSVLLIVPLAPAGRWTAQPCEVEPFAVAEGEGFEPSKSLHPSRFSRSLKGLNARTASQLEHPERPEQFLQLSAPPGDQRRVELSLVRARSRCRAWALPGRRRSTSRRQTGRGWR
jgi:hypothetical protein